MTQIKKLSEKKFVDRLEEKFLSEGFLTTREVDVGHGVADLVLINKKNINKKKLIKRKTYNQNKKLLHQKYFEILEYIPDLNSKINRKKIVIDALLKKVGVSKPYLKYHFLKFLEENNFIKKDKNNYYFKINGWIPLAKNTIAIEAKLKNWKRGFYQANRYKAFAYKSYLAIPFNISHLVDKSLFIKHNVGLIFFNVYDGKKEIVFEPRNRKPSNRYMANMAIEYFWGNNILKKLSSI